MNLSSRKCAPLQPNTSAYMVTRQIHQEATEYKSNMVVWRKGQHQIKLIYFNNMSSVALPVGKAIQIRVQNKGCIRSKVRSLEWSNTNTFDHYREGLTPIPKHKGSCLITRATTPISSEYTDIFQQSATIILDLECFFLLPPVCYRWGENPRTSVSSHIAGSWIVDLVRLSSSTVTPGIQAQYSIYNSTLA